MKFGKWEHVCCSNLSAETPGTMITLADVCQYGLATDPTNYVPSRAAITWPLAPFLKVTHIESLGCQILDATGSAGVARVDAYIGVRHSQFAPTKMLLLSHHHSLV